MKAIVQEPIFQSAPGCFRYRGRDKELFEVVLNVKAMVQEPMFPGVPGCFKYRAGCFRYKGWDKEPLKSF